MQNNTCSIPDCELTVRARGWCQKHYRRWHYSGSPTPMTSSAPVFASWEDRFWAKVKKTNTCWEWQAATVRGYGYFFYMTAGKKRNGRAHRIAYELLIGPIPEGHDLDHMCHSKACVNPSHLRPTTRKQNMENRSGPNANSRSGYRGVHWKASTKKWTVVVGHNGKHYRGGCFTDRHDAGRAAQALRLKLFTHSEMDKAVGDEKVTKRGL